VQFIHDSLHDFLSTIPKLADVLNETLADLEVSLLVSNCLDQLVERVLVLHVPALLLELLELSLHLRLTPVVGIDDPLYFLLAFLSHRLLHAYPYGRKWIQILLAGIRWRLLTPNSELISKVLLVDVHLSLDDIVDVNNHSLLALAKCWFLLGSR
jgi:hypothetical protein